MTNAAIYVHQLYQFLCGCMFSLGFPHSSVGKDSACNAGDPDSIPESGRSARKGIGYSWVSLVAQLVKNPPAMWETCVGNPWRRERLPTPVFWSGEFHGLYSPWDHKELDTTEQLSFTQKASLKSERTTYPGSSISSHPMEHPRSSDSDLGSPGMRAPL